MSEDRSTGVSRLSEQIAHIARLELERENITKDIRDAYRELETEVQALLNAR